MASRFFLTFCVVVLFAFVLSAYAEEEIVEDVDDTSEIDFDELDSVEIRASIGKKVVKILKKFFKNATERCLKDAVKKCKKHWYNPAKVIKCAKDFLSIENAQCVVGA